MKTPERSAAIARALAEEGDGLPKDFAARVAAMAEADAAAQPSRWGELALATAFIAMIGLCAAGWLRYGAGALGDVDWWRPIARVLASQPWLVVAIVGIAIVQGLTFRRRV